jgi:hypothetical protein
VRPGPHGTRRASAKWCTLLRALDPRPDPTPLNNAVSISMIRPCYLNPGSLIIGSAGLNYGGGTHWNGGNAAGLMMECNSNTEIVVNDNGKRLVSLMYYEGDTTNRLTIGRNMGWDAISSVVMNGNVTVNSSLFTTANITIGLNNSYPDLRFGSANGNNIGIATTATAFSNSSGVNDMVIRSINK